MNFLKALLESPAYFQCTPLEPPKPWHGGQAGGCDSGRRKTPGPLTVSAKSMRLVGRNSGVRGFEASRPKQVERVWMTLRSMNNSISFGALPVRVGKHYHSFGGRPYELLL